jgi:uncharacterized iron-regulated protein
MRTAAQGFVTACLLAGCGAADGVEPTSPSPTPSAAMSDELPPSTPTPAAQPEQATFGAPWSTSLLADHALVGRIWQPSSKTFVEREALEQQVARARFVLLGEKHDNPDHHRLQVEMVTVAVDQPGVGRPALALEMLDVGAQPALDRWRSGASQNADAFAEAVDWTKGGWDWSMYRSIVAKGLELDMPILAANLSRDQARAIVKQGTAAPALDGLTLPELSAPQLAELEQELRDSHCGMLPEQILPGMVLAQRARDAMMAKQLRLGRHGAVLIAGTGHVRTDRGVGAILGEPAEEVLTLAWLEVRRGVDDPAQYYTSRSGEEAPFDYLWFTPRLDEKDHCEELRKKYGSASKAEP